MSKREEPSEFEFVFMFNGVRYQYGFSATVYEVVSEWLFEAPEGRLRELFQRNKQEFKFGSSLKGQKKLIEGSTRDNMLFLTTGVQLNNEHLREVYNWFSENIFFARRHDKNAVELSNYTVKKSVDENYRARISSFLKAADVGIDNYFIHDDSQEEFGKVNDNEDDQVLRPLFLHPIKNSEYKVAFDLTMESDGTQSIFVLSSLWLDVLDIGGILFIDEIEGSLHPHLVEFLIKVFLNKDTNKSGAQLVFTTHESTVMKKGLLRRDQIWFAEKDNDLATNLFPLSDFSPRKGEAIQKAYLLGKYGAVPYIGKKFNG
jgi:AAA15 family ATPase/GTPase